MKQISRLLTTVPAAAALLSAGGASVAQAPSAPSSGAYGNNGNGAAAPAQPGGGYGGYGGFGGGGRRGRGGFGRGAGFGQAAAAPSPAPWKQFKLPNATVKLDFRNASIDSVLHVFSQASGIAIIKDPTLVGGITLQSPKGQKLSDAFEMLQAVLGLKNYELAKQGNFMIVRTKQAGPSMPNMTAMAQMAGQGGGSDQPVLQVYTLQYANATDVARVINDVYATANTQQNQNPFGFGGPGGPGGPGGGGGGFGGFGRGRFGANNAAGQTVHASADDYSNSLVVSAPSKVQDDIAGMIQQIDRQTTQPMQAKVFRLQYALADDLQPEVQSILQGASPTGRGGQTTQQRQNRNNRGGFPFFFGFGNNNNSDNGTVSADTRTNSLIVTATEQTLAQIGQVIDTLDKPATYESTTFVYVMKNARADVVANLLNESFGNRTTNGPTGGSLTNNGLTQASASSTGTTTSSTTPTGLGGNNGNRGGNNGINNFTVTASNQQNQTPATTGIDAQGHVVNIRNLTGQVLLVPNIDTNSIIVVAPPEDRHLVESILDQMDQAPEQVMIETLVVEATLDKEDQLGVEYNFSAHNPFGGLHGILGGSQSFGQQANTTQPQGLRYTLTAGQYSVFLHALQTDTTFNVLSTPRIFTTNNATAQINVSESLPYVTNQTIDANGVSFFSYNFLPVGLVLTVTPRIMSNGNVMMDVTQTADNFVSYTSFNAPITNQRQTQTTVNVKDGNTVVLGGIINNQVSSTINKVPLLGDLPIIGSLFRSTSKSNQKTELLVFMTPHIVRDDTDAALIRQQTEKDLDHKVVDMLPKTAPDATTAAK